MQSGDVAVQLSEKIVSGIQSKLLEWYQHNKRDLPWREDKNPYKIWVSEIMLQQTRVDTVIPYFQRFIKQFPTIENLAQASEEEVLKAWEGLGYYSRVRNLHAAVKEVKTTYGGRVPNQMMEISKLKGVGPYTAGAILSIAFEKNEPAVDGNVMRVFSRLFALKDDIAQVKTRKVMEKIARKLIPQYAPGDFNQALMELGAMVCVPSSPRCLLCPLQEHCSALPQGMQSKLPIKTKAKAPLKQQMIFMVIRQADKILVEQRPNRGLLSKMWALPTIESTVDRQQEKSVVQWCQEHDLDFLQMQKLGELEHIFSHRHWKVNVHSVECSNIRDIVSESLELWTIEKFLNTALAKVYRKATDLFI